MNKITSLLIFGLFFLAKSVYALSYDYTDTKSITIPMNLTKVISTRDEIYEGQEIELKVRKNIYCHNLLIVKKGQIVKAKIETIITKGMNGFPAEIIIDNFKIDGIEDSQLMSTYIKTGRNYALLVYPLKWALTPIPLVGSLTNLIKGGEAEIYTDDIVNIQYFPHWK